MCHFPVMISFLWCFILYFHMIFISFNWKLLFSKRGKRLRECKFLAKGHRLISLQARTKAWVTHSLSFLQPGIQPGPSTVQVWCLHHWTAREVPCGFIVGEHSLRGLWYGSFWKTPLASIWRQLLEAEFSDVWDCQTGCSVVKFIFWFWVLSRELFSSLMIGYDYNLFLKSFCHFFGLHLKLVFKLLKLLPFFRGTEMLHLAVLHSRRLCVYSVSGKKHFLFLM